MKRILWCLTAAFILSACSGKTVQAPPPAAPVPAPAEPFEMVIIETDFGKEDPALTKALEKRMKAPAEIRKIDYAAAKADPVFKDMDLSFMPLYLIKKTDATEQVFKEFFSTGLVKERGDYYMFPRQTRTGVYTDKPVKKNTLELFVMSQCPAGVAAENKIIAAQKAGQIPTGIKITVRYLVTDMGDGNFRSLHGAAEWEEDVRQIIIQQKYPALFWKYLEIRNRNYQSSRWDAAMKEAGIDASKISADWDKGLELLKKDAAAVKEFNIGFSPEYLWEGRVLTDGGNVHKIKGLEFLEFRPANPGGPAAAPGSCR